MIMCANLRRLAMQEYFLFVEHWPSEAVKALGFKATKPVIVVPNLP